MIQPCIICWEPAPSLSLASPTAHRSRGRRWWTGPHVPWQLPGRLQDSPLHRVPRPAGHVPLLCQWVQFLAQHSERRHTIFFGTIPGHFEDRPGPAPEGQPVSGVHEIKLEGNRHTSEAPWPKCLCTWTCPGTCWHIKYQTASLPGPSGVLLPLLLFPVSVSPVDFQLLKDGVQAGFI